MRVVAEEVRVLAVQTHLAAPNVWRESSTHEKRRSMRVAT